MIETQEIIDARARGYAVGYEVGRCQNMFATFFVGVGLGILSAVLCGWWF